MTDFTATRARFHLPEGMTYLDGNSLGPLPVHAADRVAAMMRDEWGEMLITGWNRAGWMDAPRRVADRIAPLIGARPAPSSWATRCRSRSTRRWPRRSRCGPIAA